MLLSALHLWSQDRKSINDQNYIYENKVWKQIDSESGKSYPLSDEITIQFKRPPSKAQIRAIEQSYNATFMRSNRLGFMILNLRKPKCWMDINAWLMKLRPNRFLPILSVHTF